MSQSNNSIRILAEPVRSLAFGSIGGAYMGIGTSLSNPSRILYLLNDTNATLMFSYDGITDNQPLPASSAIILDLTANRTQTGGAAFIAEGTRIYVKQVGTPTSGSVYVSTYYGSIS